MKYPFPVFFSTHLPVLQAVIEVLKPQRVLELGAGPYSTPLLHASGVELVTIEHQKPWYDKMLSELRPRDGWDFRHIPIPFRPTAEHSQLPPRARRAIDAMLRSLGDELDWFDCLFIDGPVSTRAPAMRILHPRCNVIVAHDSDTPLCGYDAVYPALARAGFQRVMCAAIISITDVVVRSSCNYDLEAYKRAVVANTKDWLDEYGMQCFNDRMIQTKGHW